MDGYQHWPAFDKLCDLAEKSGLQVGLAVSDLLHAPWTAGTADEHRQLTRIELWLIGAQRTEHPMASAPIYDDDLEAASLYLLQRVA